MNSYTININLSESLESNKRAQVEDKNIPSIQEVNSVPRSQSYK